MEALRFEKAKYILSAPDVDLLPVSEHPEIAFFGRSNVGKSSLINYLCGQKSLARTSKTPGRTQALNLFEAELNKKPVRIVDLPGHGYAKLSLKQRKELSNMLMDYLEKRETLQSLFHLLDCRRDVSEEDVELSYELRNSVENYCVILTKIDQIPVSKRKNAQKRFVQVLGIPLENCFMASSLKNIGRFEILASLT
ncbi:MAG: ribosome biogenesis GTP-binding protein YsxC [Deltaproteobacteria bacterium]|nr:ribosome biogenesis GTP-binding protein YsxC [Deltaproteobacteria bacterium]